MLYEFDGRQPVVGETSYVSDTARVIGDVLIGDHCYIGHGAILRGDYGRIEIGNGTAVEEGAIVHAPPADLNRIGQKVTIGHGAVVHGKHVGDCAVIGMGAILSNLVRNWNVDHRCRRVRGKIETDDSGPGRRCRKSGQSCARSKRKRPGILAQRQTDLHRSG